MLSNAVIQQFFLLSHAVFNMLVTSTRLHRWLDTSPLVHILADDSPKSAPSIRRTLGEQFKCMTSFSQTYFERTILRSVSALTSVKPVTVEAKDIRKIQHRPADIFESKRLWTTAFTNSMRYTPVNNLSSSEPRLIGTIRALEKCYMISSCRSIDCWVDCWGGPEDNSRHNFLQP